MASRSSRLQADLDAVLRRAGLVLDAVEIEALAAQLAAAGLVTDPIPLSFGSFIVRVTAKGQQAAPSG